MRSQTLKLFGLTGDQINDELKKLGLNNEIVNVYVKEKYQDTFMVVEEKAESEEYSQSLSKIVSTFAKYIYADHDVSLYERLYEILSVRHKTIALMEQATGGIITNNLMTFDGAESIIKASYIMPSIKAMIDHFDLSPFKFTANGGVCGEIAFDIASSIRSRIAADLYVVCISTLADGSKLYYNKNEVTAYVAIGTESGVKIFKTESNARKRDHMNNLAKTICFKLINILK